MFFSIIVPAYNVEKYLEACVKSVLYQSYQDFEIIIVDDGSKDSTGEICDKLAKNNEFIKVIHQENGGLSCARNVGIKNASGKYIVFLDSDDELEKQALEKIKTCLETNDVDILHVGYQVYFIDGKTDAIILENNLYKDKVALGKEYLKYLINNNIYSAPVVQYICKREYLLEYNLLFNPGILHEDEEFTPKLLQRAKKVLYLNISHYKYIKRENSITTNRSSKNYLDLLRVSRSIYDTFVLEKDLELRKLMLDQAVFFYMFGSYIYKDNFSEMNRNYYFSPIELLKYRIGIKSKLTTLIFIFNKKLYFKLRRERGLI